MGQGFPGPARAGIGDQRRGGIGESGFPAEDGFRGSSHADDGSAPLVVEAHFGGSFVTGSGCADIGPGSANRKSQFGGGFEEMAACGRAVGLGEIGVGHLGVEERAGFGGHAQVEEIVRNQQVSWPEFRVQPADGGGGEHCPCTEVCECGGMRVVCDPVRGGLVSGAMSGQEDDGNSLERSLDKTGDSPRGRDGTLRT